MYWYYFIREGRHWYMHLLEEFHLYRLQFLCIYECHSFPTFSTPQYVDGMSTIKCFLAWETWGCLMWIPWKLLLSQCYLRHTVKSSLCLAAQTVYYISSMDSLIVSSGIGLTVMSQALRGWGQLLVMWWVLKSTPSLKNKQKLGI